MQAGRAGPGWAVRLLCEKGDTASSEVNSSSANTPTRALAHTALSGRAAAAPGAQWATTPSRWYTENAGMLAGAHTHTRAHMLELPFSPAHFHIVATNR